MTRYNSVKTELMLKNSMAMLAILLDIAINSRSAKPHEILNSKALLAAYKERK